MRVWYNRVGMTKSMKPGKAGTLCFLTEPFTALWDLFAGEYDTNRTRELDVGYLEGVIWWQAM